MSEKAIVTLVIFLGGSLLTLARRWNNTDADAGGGVAGWTIFAIIIYWFFQTAVDLQP